MTAYTQIEIPGLAPDEIGYQIVGTTQCCSVRLSRANGCAAHMFGVTACAFALDAQGFPTITDDGKTVEGWHTTSCQKRDLIVDGAVSLAKVGEIKEAATLEAIQDMLAGTITEAAFNDLGL